MDTPKIIEIIDLLKSDSRYYGLRGSFTVEQKTALSEILHILKIPMEKYGLKIWLEKIDDLILQATTERSHYYTANLLKECKGILIALTLRAEKAEKRVKELENSRLTKDEFHSILSEFPPSIAEDSGQPEWTQGEIDKVWDFITKKAKYICTKDFEAKKLAQLKKENKRLKDLMGFDSIEQLIGHIEGKCTPYDYIKERLERAKRAEQQLADIRGRATVERIEEIIKDLKRADGYDLIRKVSPSGITIIAQAISKMLNGA